MVVDPKSPCFQIKTRSCRLWFVNQTVLSCNLLARCEGGLPAYERSASARRPARPLHPVFSVLAYYSRRNLIYAGKLGQGVIRIIERQPQDITATFDLHLLFFQEPFLWDLQMLMMFFLARVIHCILNIFSRKELQRKHKYSIKNSSDFFVGMCLACLIASTD